MDTFTISVWLKNVFIIDVNQNYSTFSSKTYYKMKEKYKTP